MTRIHTKWKINFFFQVVEFFMKFVVSVLDLFGFVCMGHASPTLATKKKTRRKQLFSLGLRFEFTICAHVYDPEANVNRKRISRFGNFCFFPFFYSKDLHRRVIHVSHFFLFWTDFIFFLSICIRYDRKHFDKNNHLFRLLASVLFSIIYT